MRSHRTTFFIGALLLMHAPAWADGGNNQQSITLKAGWNLVWFTVNPTPADPSSVLAGLDFSGVWSFLPGNTPGEKGRWVSFEKDKPAYVNTLNELQGGRGYLIRMNTAGTLVASGTPVQRTSSFAAQSSTLFGVHLGADQHPTFAQYFAFSGANQKIQSIFKLSGNVFSPVSPLSPIESDVSYWITFSQDVQYQGPFRVTVSSRGYQFGPRGYVDRVLVEVQAASSEQSLQVRALASSTPSAGMPADASNGNPQWLEFNDVSDPGQPVWRPLASGATLKIPGGQTRGELEIRCVRAGHAAASIATTNSLYQALITVTDADGNTQTYPAGMEILPFNGTYVGQVRLTKVSTPGAGSTLKPAQPMSASLILSLPGTEGGPLQLLAEKVLNTHRDGRAQKYRYSSVLFTRPVDLSGVLTGNATGGTLTGVVHMDAEDPINPYRHRYNPEHRTGYAIDRQITLEFTANDPSTMNNALGLGETAGDNELNGFYTEVISGLSLQPITVRGTFKLHRLAATTDFTPAP